MKARTVLAACTILGGLVAAGLAPGVARADIGLRGPAYTAGTSGAPTTSKPESKLWFNDGFWWAVMARPSATGVDYHIMRLRLRPQRWVDTGVLVDERGTTRQDVLWTGSKLFVASHKFVDVTSNTAPGANDEMNLYRFSYDTGTNKYTPDAGFPTTIDVERSETLVIDADTTGVLWATWVQADGSGHHVYVKSTTGDCVSGASGNCNWGGATVLDDVGADDISSVVRFGNNIGVMWSNTSAGVGQMRFGVHPNGGAWSSIEPVLGGPTEPKLADDHINLKADSSGRVYAVTKTKYVDQQHGLAGVARSHPSDRPPGPAAQHDPSVRGVDPQHGHLHEAIEARQHRLPGACGRDPRDSGHREPDDQPDLHQADDQQLDALDRAGDEPEHEALLARLPPDHPVHQGHCRKQHAGRHEGERRPVRSRRERHPEGPRGQRSSGRRDREGHVLLPRRVP
jgi:hypothetical protein